MSSATETENSPQTSIDRIQSIPHMLNQMVYSTQRKETYRNVANETDSCTIEDTNEPPDIYIPVTETDESDLDLFPEYSFTEALESAKTFVQGLPDDLIDIDLGPDH